MLAFTAKLPADVDHIVYAVPRLDQGMDAIERSIGVRPVASGCHPMYGTHNAVLSLGPDTYLEVIAPDPELARPPRGVPFDMDHGGEPRIATWALRAESIEEAVASARMAGLEVGNVEAGRREAADGAVLSWRLSDPYVMALDGCVPFLISWGKTPHPAGVAPRGGELVGLRVEHPNPAGVSAALAVLGVEMDVRESKAIRLIATIRTKLGDVILQ